MSKRKSKAITIGKSEKKCPKCKSDMITRKHPEITPKLRNQYYYFSQWDYCKSCNKVFFNENHKILNPKGVELEEYNQQQSFIKSI